MQPFNRNDSSIQGFSENAPTNAYDHRHRRTKKTVQRLHAPPAAPPSPPPLGEWTTTETHTYVWDGNNIALETIAYTNGTVRTCEYFWGPDLSGIEQGAGGVGGLLAVLVSESPAPNLSTFPPSTFQLYFPCYDNNGNVTRYLDATGATVAAFAYDAFGNTIAATGPLADAFPHRFSTKYHDPETGLCYYGYRYYSPSLMRWLTRDPIDETDSYGLYSFCKNSPTSRIDPLGLATIREYVLGSIGYDMSRELLGPYGLPVPALGARLQIHIYVSGNFAECCENGKKKVYALGTAGAEAYLTSGQGMPNKPKGRDRNKPDPYRPGKRKNYNSDPPDSGYRSRTWHLDTSISRSRCPETGLHFSGMSGVIFLRGSAGMGVGVQTNIQKEFREGVDLTEGWSVAISGAWNVWGATIDFGGGGFASWTYLNE